MFCKKKKCSEFPFLSSAGVGGGEEALAKSLDAFCSLREEVSSIEV
jgi:hypothetical protein